MSGFEALGAAGSILQFIGYGIKICNKAIAVYHGKDELRELQQMISQYQEDNANFIRSLKIRSSGPNSGEALLLKTAGECKQTATELLQLIQGLVLKEGEKSKLIAVKRVFKSEYHKSDVQAKKTLLQNLQKQCEDQLIRLMSDRQYNLADTLARIERRQEDFDSTLIRRLTNLKNDIIAAVQSSKPTEVVLVSQQLLHAHKLGTIDLPQERILLSLKYPEMRNRRDRIEEPGRSTLEWIFQAGVRSSHSTVQTQLPEVRYVPWLEDGNGIFWITGKAGSGKSTLMKYICNEPRTLEALNRWANGRKLLTASHYFWYLGSPMEKSYLGLLQSILHQILQSCPDLAKQVCANRWLGETSIDDIEGPWTPAEILRCLDKLFAEGLEFESRQVCFCFFIDGLDEYDGDYEVVDALVQLARIRNIKICASSRLWNKFDVAFVDSKLLDNFLELHQHTRGDIAKVVQAELKETLVNLKQAEKDWEPLVTEVVDRSEGVFLWVTLILKKELRPMPDAREDLAALRRRLDVIPKDLNEYFQRLFQRIWADTKHRRDTARIFKSCIAATEPLPILAIECLINPSLDCLAASMRQHGSTSLQERLELAEKRRAKLNDRCHDLLSASAPLVSGFEQHPSSDSHPPIEVDLQRIEFLHRSVRDFLNESATIAQELDKYAGPAFDVHYTLSTSYLFMVSKAAKIWKWKLRENSTFSYTDTKNWASGWSSKCLFHLGRASPKQPVKELVHELDGMIQYMSTYPHLHWSAPIVATVEYRMDSEQDLIAYTTELGLTSYVEAILEENPKILHRHRKRPYLAYTLDLEFAVQAGSFHSSEVPERLAMVRLLLERGCDPNEKMEGHTLFEAYLQHIRGNRLHELVHRKITWLLIEHGVKSAKVVRQRQRTTAWYHKKNFRNEETIEYAKIPMITMLTECFGEEEAKAMCERIAKNDAAGGWWNWASSFRGFFE